MWEKDRKLLRAFKECYANLNAQLLAGEEVEIAGACSSETEALINYTIKSIAYYKSTHAPEMSDKKARYYTPKQPFFQDL